MSYNEVFRPQWTSAPVAWTVFSGQILITQTPALIRVTPLATAPSGYKIYWYPDSATNSENAVVGPIEPYSIFLVSTPGRIRAFSGSQDVTAQALQIEWALCSSSVGPLARTMLSGIVPGTGIIDVGLSGIAGGSGTIYYTTAGGDTAHVNLDVVSPFVTYRISGALAGSTWYAAGQAAL